MASEKTAPYSPSVAAAMQAGVQAFLLAKPQADVIHMTRAAALEFSLGAFVSAEAAMMASKLSPASSSPVLGASDAAAFKAFDPAGLHLDVDVTKGVPPQIATSAHYLATRRAQKLMFGTSRKAPDGASIDIDHQPLSGGDMIPIPVPSVPSLPSGAPAPGTVNIPGVGSFPVPPLTLPGPIVPLSDVDDFGDIQLAAVVGVVGVVALIAGAWVVDDVLKEREVTELKKAEIETAAKVKVATDLCAAQAAAGQPCDVGKVVASLAVAEKRDHDLLPFVVIGGVALLGGAAYYAFKHR